MFAKHHEEGVQLACSPDSTLIASGSSGKTILLWDNRKRCAEQKTIQKLTVTENGEIRPVAFSPDSAFLVHGSTGGSITVVDVATRKEAVKTKGGHAGGIITIAFAPVLGNAGRKVKARAKEDTGAAKQALGKAEPLTISRKRDQVDMASLTFGKQIGTGRTCRVFRGEYAKANTPSGQAIDVQVAIKQQNAAEYLKDPQAFIAENELLMKCDSPFVTNSYGVGFEHAESPSSNLVMELCDLGDLTMYTDISMCPPEVMNGTKMCPVPYAETILIVLNIFLGLASVHDKRIIHRDMAARNVTLKTETSSSEGVSREYLVAQLIDFDMSCELEEGKECYRVTENMDQLPIAWLSPEIFAQNIERRTHLVNFASDLWAAGVAVYELVTNCSGGHRKGPYLEHGTIRKSVKGRVLKDFKLEDMTDIREFVCGGHRLHIPAECPKELRILMEELWNKDADERPSALQSILFLRNECSPLFEAKEWKAGDESAAAQMNKLFVEDLGIQIPNALELFRLFDYKTLVDDAARTEKVKTQRGAEFTSSNVYMALEREIKALRVFVDAVGQEPLRGALDAACEKAKKEKCGDKCRDEDSRGIFHRTQCMSCNESKKKTAFSDSQWRYGRRWKLNSKSTRNNGRKCKACTGYLSPMESYIAAMEKKDGDVSVDEIIMGNTQIGDASNETKDDGHDSICQTQIVDASRCEPKQYLLASGGKDKTVVIYKIKPDKSQCDIFRTLTGRHDGPVYSVAFSPSLVELQGEHGIKHVRLLASGSDFVGSASRSGGRNLVLWDVEAGIAMKELIGHTSRVSSLAFSPDSTLLVSGSFDETVIVWGSKHGLPFRKIKTHEGIHTDRVTTVAFSADSNFVASGSKDTTVAIFDVFTGDEAVPRLKHHTDEVTSVIFVPDSKPQLSALQMNTLRELIEKAGIISTKKSRRWFEHFIEDNNDDSIDRSEFAAALRNLYFDCGEKKYKELIEIVKIDTIARVATASKTGDIARTTPYDSVVTASETGVSMPTRGGREGVVRYAEERSENIHTVAFSHDARLVASALTAITLWDTATGRQVFKLGDGHHEDSVMALAFSQDSTLLASGDVNGTVVIWDTVTGRFLRKLVKYTEMSVVAIVFRSKVEVECGSHDGAVICWDYTKVPVGARNVRGGEQVETPVAARAKCITFSCDLKLAAAEFATETTEATEATEKEFGIILWTPCKLESAKPKRKNAKVGKTNSVHMLLGEHKCTVTAVAFSCDSKFLASGDEHETVILWDTSNGALLRRIKIKIPDSTSSIACLAFTPCGGFVALGRKGQRAKTKTTSICSTETGTEVVSGIELHGADGINAISFSPDGRKICSAGFDYVVATCDLFWLTAMPILRGQGNGHMNLTDTPTTTLAAAETKSGVKVAPLLTLKDLGELINSHLSPDGSHTMIWQPSPAGPTDRSPLHYAAEHRNLDALSVFLQTPLQLNRVTKDSYQTLVHAVAAGYANPRAETEAVQAIEVLYQVMKQKFNFAEITNKTDRTGRTALSLAIDHAVEHDGLAQSLLDHKALPSIADNSGRTPLHYACYRCHESCALMLLKYSAEINAQDKHGHTPLLIAALQGSLPLVRTLVEHGARHEHEAPADDLKRFTKSAGWWPLSLMVEIKLDKENTGSVMVNKDKEKSSVIFNAGLTLAEEVKKRKDHGENHQGKLGENLHKHYGTVRKEDETCAEPESKVHHTKRMKTMRTRLRSHITGGGVLHEAAKERDANMFGSFMKVGLKYPAQSGSKGCRTRWNTGSGTRQRGKLLQSLFVPASEHAERRTVNSDTQKQTLRIIELLAVHWGKDLTDALNYHGEKDDQTKTMTKTVLALAIDDAFEQSSVVDFLLSQKADPLIVDNARRAPLHFACVRGHVHCATSLIASFANVDAQDENGRTPLLISAIQGSVPLVFLLLHHGARHDVSDENGWLPLSYSLMPLKSEGNQKELRIKAEKCADLNGSYDEEGIAMVAEKKRADDVLKGANTNVATDSSSQAAKDAQKKAKADADAIDGTIRDARDRIKTTRPDDNRYETIAMALLKKENHLDAAIEDNIPLFTESLERHFDASRANLVRAFYDPTDSYDNDLYRDPLLQRAIDLEWTSKVYPSALWSLMQFSFFLIVVCLVGALEAGQLTTSPHSLDVVFDTIFIGENWDDYGVKEFSDIGNAGELWPWIENVFLGGVYPDPEVWYDDKGALQASPVAANEWVGRPRMRTLEGSPEMCAYNDTVVSSVQCFSSDLTKAPSRWTNRADLSQQLHPDGFGWQSPGGSAGDVGWTRGVFNNRYPDAGLVVTMPDDKEEAEALVAKLKAGDWINLNTRAFIAEFTAYNANTGLYTVGQIMVEMPSTGVYMPSFQFRNFPRVSYSFSNTSDIARLVLEVIFLAYFFAIYLVAECKQVGVRWEDPVEKNSPHWNLSPAEENKMSGETAKKFEKRLEIARISLKKTIEESKPTLGSILLGNLNFKNERARGIVSNIKKLGDYVVIRPYFYEAFSYFDIGLILCFAFAIILQVVQLVQEMNALPKICAGNEFVSGSFVIAQTHVARMYLIAFGSFFCWCKVRQRVRVVSLCKCELRDTQS